jgi:hypothetical protein
MPVCPVSVQISITKLPHTCGVVDVPIEFTVAILLSIVSPILGALGKYLAL